MKNKNEYKESFLNWIRTKGGILLIGILLTGICYLVRWVFVIPYHIHNYLNIGSWGLVIGGFIMFIAANIPIGIVSILLKLDEENIIWIEVGCVILTILVMFGTAAHIRFPPI